VADGFLGLPSNSCQPSAASTLSKLIDTLVCYQSRIRRATLVVTRSSSSSPRPARMVRIA
jgi:hypothetical protein